MRIQCKCASGKAGPVVFEPKRVRVQQIESPNNSERTLKTSPSGHFCVQVKRGQWPK